MTSISRSERARGFSLLEMLVALVMLAFALGALYQAAGGATRNVRSDEKYAYAVEVARSLLADYAAVPVSGVSVSGSAGDGFTWQVQTRPVELGRRNQSRPVLHYIEVDVRWADGRRKRQLRLDSVVEGYVP